MPTIRERLENEILPYVAAAEAMKARWDFRGAQLFKGLQALGAAMAAAGVVIPFFPTEGGTGSTASLAPSIAATGALAVGGTALTIAMTLIRDWLQSEETQLRLVRMRGCIRGGAEAEFDLREALQLADPRVRLTEIQGKVRAQVRDCVTCGVVVKLDSDGVVRRVQRMLGGLPKFDEPAAPEGEQKPKA